MPVCYPDIKAKYNRLDRLTKAAKELSEATGRTCIPAQADVRDPNSLRDAVSKTINTFGRIDFVICGTSPSNWM
jgi:peroxisomal 2,4-dienoyl-CoA reductase